MIYRKLISRFIVAVLLIIIVFTGFVIFKMITVKPPLKEVTLAREAIALAKNALANKYAVKKLGKAEQLFNDALNEWDLQNEKWFVFRNYNKTAELAVSSLKFSIDAQADAGNTKSNLKNRLENQLATLKNRIDSFEKQYKNLPLEREIFDWFNEGKLNYLEADNNLKKGEFQKGLVLSAMADKNLNKAENTAHEELQNYFGNYIVWKSNIQTAVLASKKGQAVILVNKTALTVSVLKSGKTQMVFEAEFGPNWIGDKRMKGDRSTPEGIYKVTEKKKGVKTKYHKALLLNYPNAEDKARFEKLKRTGAIPKNTQIGGLIEIHGAGGKGIHWTDGCVALKNKDMDVVYDLCQNSTPVIIVGSDLSFDEYLKSRQ